MNDKNSFRTGAFCLAAWLKGGLLTLCIVCFASQSFAQGKSGAEKAKEKSPAIRQAMLKEMRAQAKDAQEKKREATDKRVNDAQQLVQKKIQPRAIPAQAFGQLQFNFGGAPVAPGAPDDSEFTKIGVESGAVLKTDPELEGILEKADRFRADGNYRIACQLWQIVLQRSGDTLYSSDGSNYFSLVEQVESVLASLPPEGLEAYRVLADAEAKEIMAQAKSKTDELALSKVVRQYFISSLGDEAAFDLGCIYLDRFEFIGARRMFEKVVRQYPDSDISLDQLYTRIALCQSFLGDLESAEESLALADAARAKSEGADLVRRSLGELTANEGQTNFDADWTMAMGDSRRYGITASVPDEMMEGDLEAIWQFYYDPRDKFVKAADSDGNLLTGKNAHAASVLETRTSLEERMIKSWRDKGWRPAGRLLLQGGRVYFKTGTDLTVWDGDAVEEFANVDSEKPQLASALAWRSLWDSAFQMDEATKMLQMIRKSYGAFNRRGGRTTAVSLPEPTTDSEVQIFGDGIFQQMSIYKGTLFNIEGTRFNFEGRNVAQVKRLQPQWNTSYRRSRTNRLTAYDSKTGMLKWALPRELPEAGEANAAGLVQDEQESQWLSGGGFMAAPVGYGDLVIVPVNMGGAISVYALDPKDDGKTIWKSFLCDEPESGAVPWSAIDISIDGSDLFVNCGMGVIFVLDPSTGLVRFAKRYSRVGKADEFQRRNNWTTNRLNFEGWSSDLVIPYGRQMICLSSDTNIIQAFDRNSGEQIWRNSMNPVGYQVDYLLGVYDDYLYAAGSETIVAFDLQGDGRMIWGSEQVFEEKLSFGRGVLTPSGIYMPVGDGIYQFGLKGHDENADLLAKVHVDLGTDAPVGNLYSDGKRFWVHGGNRLYALARKKSNGKQD